MSNLSGWTLYYTYRRTRYLVYIPGPMHFLERPFSTKNYIFGKVKKVSKYRISLVYNVTGYIEDILIISKFTLGNFVTRLQNTS